MPGRKIKVGLDYFPVDCLQDDHIELLIATHGMSGYGIYIQLLRRIYQLEGYYCAWNEKLNILFAKSVGESVDQVNAVLETCLEEGLFNRYLYNKWQVLTSADIQFYWQKIISLSKRKGCEIDARFNLLIDSISSEEMHIDTFIDTKKPQIDRNFGTIDKPFDKKIDKDLQENGFIDKEIDKSINTSSSPNSLINAISSQEMGDLFGRIPEEITRIEEKRIEEKRIEEEMFNRFWNVYDKKVNKVETEKKWKKLKDDERLQILNVVAQYVAATPDKQFRKDPSTYLNKRAWEDELPSQQNSFTSKNPRNGRNQNDQPAFGSKPLLTEAVPPGGFGEL